MPKEFANAQDLVAIKEIRDSTLVLKDGGLRQVLMVSGVNFALRSETEQNIITAGYQNFLNTLDFPLQIIIHSRKINIDKYLQKLASYEQAEPSPLLRNQNAEYREFIRGFVEKNAIMEKTFFAVVPWVAVPLPTAKSVLRFIPFLGRSKAAEATEAQEKEESFEESLEQLQQRVSQVVEGLAAVGLQAIPLGNRELAEMLYNFYNPESVEKEGMTLPAEANSNAPNSKS
jgi:type IV secretory pathway VirB4 component